MAKGSGGTRNYSSNEKILSKRREEFLGMMNGGSYDKNRSYFDESGGFVATHNGHDQISNPNVDKSDVASVLLAKKGYKVYLDDETSTLSGIKMPDGRIYDVKMDIKTINEAGKNTIKNQLEKASKQMLGYKDYKHAAVLYQNNEAVDKAYVVSQIDSFFNSSPKILRENIDLVIVVGANGNVHRHYRNKKR